MKIHFVFSFFFFSFSVFLPAQNIWYFGNGAGLNFSSGAAKTIHDGKIFTLEGCAAVSDGKDQLLFYTDGITVWNKSHQVIQNGEGLNGSKSSTQSALILPQPGAKGKYFLFTSDEKAGKKGLCYSVIDISSGNGAVTRKNIQLLLSTTEKITAVQHANGKDVWVISHQWNSNLFCVFPVTPQGIGQPIISAMGTSHSETGVSDNKEAIGYLRASPDGKKIASVICYRSQNNLEIFDFDNSTGKISGPSVVSLSGFPYGLCFSPDNSKLYVSFLKGKSGVVQYDMNGRTITEIISNEKENSFGSLQPGPDGKIYVARTGNFLDAIELPDRKGISCAYKQSAVDLSPASCNFGLPNFWFSLSSPPSSLPASDISFPPPISNSSDCNRIIERPFSNKDKLLMTEISVCENTHLLDAKNIGASYCWSTGAKVQQITIDTSGIYKVNISKGGCSVLDSIRIKFRKEVAVFRCLPVFNPENGFINSEFYYDIEDVSGFQLTIFDSKKKRVLFETNNQAIKWDGKNPKGQLVPAGEYVWSVKYKPNCPKESKEVVKEGKVTVKRKK